jgi:acetyl-CoA acetyltransferase
MKMNAYVAGVGMVKFGKHLDKTLKGLAGEAIQLALQDAGLDKSAIQAAWMGNAAAGVVTGQEMIRGEVALRNMGIGKIPVINVENACASSSTAFQQACALVTAGMYDVVLACGSEKLFHEDKSKSLGAFSSAVDIEDPDGAVNVVKRITLDMGMPFDASTVGVNRSIFMDIYSALAQKHMKKYGSTKEHFAMVAAKNSFHGSMNPRAQFQDVLTVEQVLAARTIIEPLTLPMCSPIGDGSAAIIIVSERKARAMGLQHKIRVAASALATGWDYTDPGESVGALASQQVYEAAGIGPQDVSCVELHDASAPSEIAAYEYLGLCAAGEGAQLIETKATYLGGRIPVNVSGGLLRKGHPIGATGCAQIVELTDQLRGQSGKRQVEGARIALAHNGGGAIGTDAAATVVTLLQKED